jgi:hypothetical protein
MARTTPCRTRPRPAYETPSCPLPFSEPVPATGPPRGHSTARLPMPREPCSALGPRSFMGVARHSEGAVMRDGQVRSVLVVLTVDGTAVSNRANAAKKTSTRPRSRRTWLLALWGKV